jgi:hypothetical protein
MTTEADRERYGRVAYDAYGDHVGWVVFSGAPMPTWDETLDRIREAWRAAGEKVADTVRAQQDAPRPPRTDTDWIEMEDRRGRPLRTEEEMRDGR